VSLPEIPGYQINREIGAGGMARVYLATQTSLDRPVALKVMAPALVADAQFSKRFLREAQMLAGLTHPNIVAVYEVGATNQHLHFFAMQHLSGGDLADRIQKSMSEVELVRVISCIGRALGFAHSKGVVHRDVTPGNILFDAAENPVLTDFGIARTQSGSTRITHTGVSIGTSSYMSPEQARGGNVDQRSDLYSLGALVFESLTSHPPYRGADGFAVAYAHVFEPIPRLPQHVSHWQPFIDKALAKDPDERFANAEQFVKALQDVEINAQRMVPQRALPKNVISPVPTPAPLAAPTSPSGPPPIPAADPAPTVKNLRPAELANAQAVDTVKRSLATIQTPQTVPPPARTANVDVGAPTRSWMPVALVGSLLALSGAVGFWWYQQDGNRSSPAVPIGNASPDTSSTPATGTIPNSTTAVATVDPNTSTGPGANPSANPNLDPSLTPGADPMLDPTIDPSIALDPTIALNPDGTPMLVIDPADPKPKDFGPPTREQYVKPALDRGLALQKQNKCFDARNAAVNLYRFALQTLPTSEVALKGVDECFALSTKRVSDELALATPDFKKLKTDLEVYERFAKTFGATHASNKLLATERKRVVDDLLGKAAADEKQWARSAAIAKYESVLVFDAKNKAATTGIKRAGKIGLPGFVFSDPMSAGKAPSMVVVGGGNVTLRDESGGKATLSIDRAFAVQKNEVTLADYQLFVTRSKHVTTAKGCNNIEGLALFTSKTRTWKAPGFDQESRSPVVCVGWNDAQKYVRWLSKETGENYRLLSEAEWQYLAQSAAAPSCGSGNVGDSSFMKQFEEREGYSCSDGHAGTAPVASFGANALGIADLTGNVREWTADCWNNSISAHPKTSGPWQQGACGKRVAAGTSWVSKPAEKSAIARRGFGADDLNNTVGFRVARELQNVE
jgi:serine/threonine-protein kinase PpkA